MADPEAPPDGPVPPAQRWALLALLVLLVVIATLGFLVFGHFLLVGTVAAAVALFLAPLYGRARTLLRGHAGLAAGLLVALTAFTLLIPASLSATILSRQALAFFEWARPRLTPEALKLAWHETLPAHLPWLRDYVRFDDETLLKLTSEALSRAASNVNALVQTSVAGVASALLDLVLFLMMLFFLLRDGATLRAELGAISPLPDHHEDELLQHLARTVKAVLQAMVLVPVAQGIVAFPGLALFGLPSPLLWSVFVFLAALVPVIGSPLAWVPACVYLLLYGETWQWVGMTLYGLLVISTIDNVIKTLLLRDAARIHPLLGFLSVLGGLLSFGTLGFLVGPVILSLLLSALRIYRHEFVERPAA